MNVDSTKKIYQTKLLAIVFSSTHFIIPLFSLITHTFPSTLSLSLSPFLCPPARKHKRMTKY